MAIEIGREELLTALTEIIGVVPKRTPVERNKSLCIAVAGGVASLTATDGEITATRYLPGVDCPDDKPRLVRAYHFLRVVERLPEGMTVRIDGVEDRVSLVTKDDSYHFVGGGNVESFPVPIPRQMDDCHNLSGDAFREAIRRTIFATDVESTRYALGGVRVELETDKVTLIATDSRRIAICESPARIDGAPNHLSAVLPQKLLWLIEKLPANETLITLTESTVWIRCGDLVISSRLVEGRFPRWRDVLPRASMVTVRAKIAASSLLAACRRESTLTDPPEEASSEFTFNRDLLVIKTSTHEKGRSVVCAPLECDGQMDGVLLNTRFLIDYLQTVPPEAVITISLSDKEAPVMFDAGSNVLYVLCQVGRT